MCQLITLIVNLSVAILPSLLLLLDLLDSEDHPLIWLFLLILAAFLDFDHSGWVLYDDTLQFLAVVLALLRHLDNLD